MQRLSRFALALVLTVGAAACRQADGPIPQPARDQTNEIGDIARDMINVVNKDPQAGDDLRSDLSKYGQNKEASAKASELAVQIAQALPGARLDDATAQKLAHTMWIGVTAKQLSERQIGALQKDLKDTLTLAGVEESRAQPVADKLGEVQKATSENRRRWYQMF
jgi:hypothetical protein